MILEAWSHRLGVGAKGLDQADFGRPHLIEAAQQIEGHDGDNDQPTHPTAQATQFLSPAATGAFKLTFKILQGNPSLRFDGCVKSIGKTLWGTACRKRLQRAPAVCYR